MGKSTLQDIQTTFRDNLVYIIGTALGCVFVVILTFSPGFFESEPAPKKRGGPSAEVNKMASAIVNKNLREDQSLIELRERQAAAESQRFRDGGATVEFNPEVLAEQEYQLIDPKVYDGSEDVYEDIFGDQSAYDVHLNPSQRIEAKLQRMKMLDRYDYQQKLAYIEAFVKNAYEQGYQVDINEDLEVTRVKKITTDEPYRGSASLDKLLDRQGY